MAGQLWALGVLAEVVLFFVLCFIRTLDLRILLTISLVFDASMVADGRIS